MSKRKYEKAYRIDNMRAFASYRGTYFLVRFSDNKPLKTLHRAFIESWQYHLIETFVKRGRVYAAKKVGK